MSSGHGGGGLPGLGYIESLIHSSHEGGGYHLEARPLLITMVVMLVAFLILAPSQTLQNFNLVLFLAPIWVPAALIYFGFLRFHEWRRSEFIKNQKHILLELRLPRDTKKTPLAMETVLANLNFNAGETTWYKKYIKGAARPWWSFEIASVGGQVRFYVWCREAFRRGLESFFYAQYPGIEIIEAEDYSRIKDIANPETHEMWGTEFLLANDDPFPIKTYVDYKLDQPGTKPEEQVDPLNQLVELMGSISPHENLWLQIIFRRHGQEKYGRGRTWKDVADELIKKIQKETISKRTTMDPVTGQLRETEGFPNPTPGQKLTIEALGRNSSKPAFDVGIRAIYSCDRGNFHASMVTFLINMLRPFNDEGWNSFKLSQLFSAKFNDYPWEDVGGHHKQHQHELLTEYYRRRSYFHSPYVGPWMVLSSEELATIFHIPSSTIETPTLPRIQSATSGAPSNLPT